MVSHLPTSFASDVISVASILYVFKFLTDLLYWLSVLHWSAAFHSGTVPCVVQIFLLSVSYRSCNPWRHVTMYLPVSVAFYGHSDAFLHVSVVLDVTNLFSYVCLLPTVPEIDCFLLCLLSKVVFLLDDVPHVCNSYLYRWSIVHTHPYCTLTLCLLVTQNFSKVSITVFVLPVPLPVDPLFVCQLFLL